MLLNFESNHVEDTTTKLEPLEIRFDFSRLEILGCAFNFSNFAASAKVPSWELDLLTSGTVFDKLRSAGILSKIEVQSSFLTFMALQWRTSMV